ncbi:hypothetical protein ACPCXD_00415 [Rhodococcus sp. AB351]|uniref:hypothetical protein n=1 Tax=Rhodococcus sp. AB351 TaxID=3413280 RepID=UPI003C1A5B14
MSEASATDRLPVQDLPTGVVRADDWNGVGNEFTGVQYRKVWTRNGERLELYVPRAEKRILLDAMMLEVLAGQEPGFFTSMIAAQLGSDESS